MAVKHLVIRVSFVKLIMEAGKFNTLDDVMSKFVNSCTDATDLKNTVLYYGQHPTCPFSAGQILPFLRAIKLKYIDRG